MGMKTNDDMWPETLPRVLGQCWGCKKDIVAPDILIPVIVDGDYDIVEFHEACFDQYYDDL